MPAGLVAWVTDFVGRHHVATPFVKRRRGPKQTEPTGRKNATRRASRFRATFTARRAVPGGGGEMAGRRGRISGPGERPPCATPRPPIPAPGPLPARRPPQPRRRTSDTEILRQFDLPDPDSLQAGADFTGFLQDGVPQHLRRRALRRLWRVHPALANLDGLVDYGEDFSDAATVIENLQTAYQVGKGMLRHVLASEEAARQDNVASEESVGEAQAARAGEGATLTGASEHDYNYRLFLKETGSERAGEEPAERRSGDGRTEGNPQPRKGATDAVHFAIGKDRAHVGGSSARDHRTGRSSARRSLRFFGTPLGRPGARPGVGSNGRAEL